MVWTQESYHKSVNYDRPGECSPEKDCLWGRFDNQSGNYHLRVCRAGKGCQPFSTLSESMMTSAQTRLSKRQSMSSQTVLRTTLTRTIIIFHETYLTHAPPPPFNLTASTSTPLQNTPEGSQSGSMGDIKKQNSEKCIASFVYTSWD